MIRCPDGKDGRKKKNGSTTTPVAHEQGKTCMKPVIATCPQVACTGHCRVLTGSFSYVNVRSYLFSSCTFMFLRCHQRSKFETRVKNWDVDNSSLFVLPMRASTNAPCSGVFHLLIFPSIPLS